MKGYLRLLPLATLAMVIAAGAWAEDGGGWMLGYNARHTGVSPWDFSPPLALMWQFSSEPALKAKQRVGPGVPAGLPMMGGMEGPGMLGAMPAGRAGRAVSGSALPRPIASPVVAEDRVFFAVDSTVYCVDRITGEQLWKRGVGAKVYSTPVYVNGYLYVAGDDGRVHALRADRGSEEWVFRLDKGVRSALAYQDGVLYMGSEDGRVYALDVRQRELRWSYSTGGKVRAAPSVWRDTAYVVSQAGRLYAISLRGKQRWSAALGDKVCCVPPVVRGERVYVVAGAILRALDARLGHHRWEVSAPRLITGPIAVSDRYVFYGTREGAVYCADAATGTVRWRYPAEGNVKPVQSGVFLAGGMVITRTGLAGVVALDQETGRMLWHYKLPEPPQRATAASRLAAAGLRGGVGGMGGMGAVAGPGQGMMEGGMAMGGMAGGAAGRRRGAIAGAGGPGAPGGMVGPGGLALSRTLELEDIVSPSIALADNRLYVLGDDCVLYGLEADAPDSVPPRISDAVLEIEGEGKTRFAYAVPVDEPEQLPLRFVDLVKVPGSPPVYLSVKVVDSGCGVDPDSVQMTMDGKPLDVTYDADTGLVWFIYKPKGRGAAALRDGKHNFVVRASDWRGNQASAQFAITIDNSMSPPKAATGRLAPGAGMGGPMGPEGMMGPGGPGMVPGTMQGPGMP